MGNDYNGTKVEPFYKLWICFCLFMKMGYVKVGKYQEHSFSNSETLEQILKD
jgi:hypothetical protein